MSAQRLRNRHLTTKGFVCGAVLLRRATWADVRARTGFMVLDARAEALQQATHNVGLCGPTLSFPSFQPYISNKKRAAYSDPVYPLQTITISYGVLHEPSFSSAEGFSLRPRLFCLPAKQGL